MHMTCTCGQYLTNVSCPNDIVLWAYPDSQWKEIQAIGKIDPVMIPRATFEIWRCPKCKRLVVFRYPLNEGTGYAITNDAVLQRKVDPSYELWHVFTDVEWDDIIFPREIDASKIHDSSIKIEINGDYTRLFLHDSNEGKVLEYQFVPCSEKPTPRILTPIDDQ